MALSINYIFPIGTDVVANQGRLLEPHECSRILQLPTLITPSEARLVYRKRESKGYYRFQYQYKTIMAWELRVIENFYKRVKGRYEEFYLVDWSNIHKVTGSPSTTSLTLDHLDGLEASPGYIGKTILLHNGRITGAVNKQILTIADAEIFDDNTIDVNETIGASLRGSSSYVYILYPVIFDTEALTPTMKDFCTEKKLVNFPGYGTKNIYGQIVDINISFLQLGVLKDT